MIKEKNTKRGDSDVTHWVYLVLH